MVRPPQFLASGPEEATRSNGNDPDAREFMLSKRRMKSEKKVTHYASDVEQAQVVSMLPLQSTIDAKLYFAVYEAELRVCAFPGGGA